MKQGEIPGPFTAAGKPYVVWRGRRWVIGRIRFPRDCARCALPLAPDAFVYRVQSGSALCQPCAAIARQSTVKEPEKPP